MRGLRVRGHRDWTPGARRSDDALTLPRYVFRDAKRRPRLNPVLRSHPRAHGTHCENGKPGKTRGRVAELDLNSKSTL
jgi:hypothetical protein